MRRRNQRLLPVVALPLLLLAPLASEAEADDVPTQAVEVPLLLDYPLLEQLLITQLFTDAGTSLSVLDESNRCSDIVLRQPAIVPSAGQLVVISDLDARVGVPAGQACNTLFTLRGKLAVAGQPELRNDGTTVGFVPSAVRLLDESGQTVPNPMVQSLVDSSVRNIVNQFEVDLQPQLAAVGDLLPSVLPSHSRSQLEALLATLRLSDFHVREDALGVDVSFSIEKRSMQPVPERPLSEAELALWEERWQLMDALLVLAVKHYAAATQLQELRDALLDALIESRYRLRDALAETPGTDADAVREWFLESWQTLAPTMRRIGEEQPGQEHLLLLSVIAAADALDALDELGPSVGLDISTDGLRRLARMINSEDGGDLLQYSADVDPQLRRLFEESTTSAAPPVTWRISLSLFPRALAADRGRLNSWAPKRGDLPEYLPLVGELLNDAAATASAEKSLDQQYRELFRQLVLTTAWQESCWRHYTVSDDRKLVPMRSGTGDVGMMQVNERVWRGFYDQQRLRWDIDYNTAAGTEVLMGYLVRYAIRKGEHRQPGGLTNLARASYSAYNGGPSKLTRYRDPQASGYGKKVDTLFWEKFQAVASGNELAVSGCLGGNLSGPAVAVTRGGSLAERAGDRFTLQLGAFSSDAAAQRFIEQQQLGNNASVRRRSGSASPFLVIYGNYATRADAEKAGQRLGGREVWIRRLGDL